MNGDIKTTFIRKCLDDYQKRTVRSMQAAIQRTGAKQTGTLNDSITGDANATANSGNATIAFAEYGRFIDMGVGKGHPLGGMEAVKQNVILASGGNKRTATRVRKAKKFYSKVAYGNLGMLMSDLSYGYTQSTIEAIKAELQNNQNNIQ